MVGATACLIATISRIVHVAGSETRRDQGLSAGALSGPVECLFDRQPQFGGGRIVMAGFHPGGRATWAILALSERRKGTLP